MTIVIEGLNKKQRALAEIMWNMNGKEEVMGFIGSLKGSNRQEAETVLEMMLWAIWDDCGEITTDTKETLDKIAG